jgi:hypothetical protein
MSELRDAIREIQAVIQAVPGIRRAPSEPPEQITAFPFALAYTSAGTLQIGPPELMTGLHNIVCEIHISREAELARAIEDALRFSESIPMAIMKGLKDGTFTAFQTFGEISYTFGPLGWGGLATIGFRFTITNVKIQSVIT